MPFIKLGKYSINIYSNIFSTLYFFSAPARVIWYYPVCSLNSVHCFSLMCFVSFIYINSTNLSIVLLTHFSVLSTLLVSTSSEVFLGRLLFLSYRISFWALSIYSIYFLSFSSFPLISKVITLLIGTFFNSCFKIFVK